MVQDTVDYLQQGLKELEDKNTYVEIEEEVSRITVTKVNNLISQFHQEGVLTQYQKDKYTTNLEDVRPQRLYFLHKVHKTPHQLRPIVSCCSGPTQKISQLANILLKDYLQGVPSLVTSSTQVINMAETLQIREGSRESLLLVTLDVKALYPSIPHGAGVTMALQQAMPTNPPICKQHRTKQMLREMLLLILKENTFQFAGRNFRQIRGAAMGTPVAPTLANLFMGKLEANALNSWPGTQPLIWLRYIDDILMLFDDSVEELQKLLQHLNSQLSTVKFTAEWSSDSVNYLDITLYKGERFREEGRLDVKPYTKAINQHSYLHYSSAHPKCNLQGVVRGEIIRMLRRCSSPQTFATSMEELEQWFVARGYPRRMVRSIADQVDFSQRTERLKHRDNKTLPDLTTVLSVRQHPSISTSEVLAALFDPDLPFQPMVVRKRPPCTGDLVTRAPTSTEAVAHAYHLRSRKTTSSKNNS